MVQRFWEIDNVPQASILTPLDMACEKAYVTDHYRDSTGRYGVQLLFKDANQILHSEIYVDDIVTGCETLDEALEAKAQIIELLELGHFQLRKWASNIPELLSDIPQEECLLSSKTFTGHDSCSLKVLGLKWEPTTDTFSFDVKSSIRPCTKRVILSEIAKIFDPLGFLAPLTIKAKCLLQRLWLLGIDWDSDPPEDVNSVWETFCNQLSILKDLRIPRCMTINNTLTYELHGFCDSSELAYGAVIYIRVSTADGLTQTRLVCAKARVAPIKKISLPRLELCAAVLLSNLAKFVLDTYLTKLTLHAIYLWSDSTVVLSWLRSHSSRWTTFVANRVGHIQDIFSTEVDVGRGAYRAVARAVPLEHPGRLVVCHHRPAADPPSDILNPDNNVPMCLCCEVFL
ncbi:unnamed protein product, partial [Brenthis ino]